MRIKTFTLLSAGSLFLGLLLSGCSSDNSSEPDFDRQELLENYASRLIQPAFQDMETQATQLENRVKQFTENPTFETLSEARNGWSDAYTQWQRANAYNFGPAGESGVRKTLIEEIGTWPVAEDKVEAAILAEDHSLAGFDRDARGFLAMEYLLFGKSSSDAEVVDQFIQSESRRDHLEALSSDLLTRIAQVASEWPSYEQDFITNDGTDVGSSVSQLYNEWVKSFESVKNFKVGLPAGKRPGQTQPEPQLVEAYYSGSSLSRIKTHLQAIEDIYYGGSPGNRSNASLKTYLENVVGGAELVADTEAQWAKVMTALEAVPTDQTLQELIAAEDPRVDALHTELQKHTRFFKSDMSSLLGIAITFSSGDGD